MAKTIPISWADPKEIQIDIVGGKRLACEMIRSAIDEYKQLEHEGYIVEGVPADGHAVTRSMKLKDGVKKAQAIEVVWFFQKGIEIAIDFTGLDLSADVIRKKLKDKK